MAVVRYVLAKLKPGVSAEEYERFEREVDYAVSAKLAVRPEHRFAGFNAYLELLGSGVDVVLLCTPPHFRPIHPLSALFRLVIAWRYGNNADLSWLRWRQMCRSPDRKHRYGNACFHRNPARKLFR